MNNISVKLIVSLFFILPLMSCESIPVQGKYSQANQGNNNEGIAYIFINSKKLAAPLQITINNEIVCLMRLSHYCYLYLPEGEYQMGVFNNGMKLSNGYKFTIQKGKEFFYSVDQDSKCVKSCGHPYLMNFDYWADIKSLSNEQAQPLIAEKLLIKGNRRLEKLTQTLRKNGN